MYLSAWNWKKKKKTDIRQQFFEDVEHQITKDSDLQDKGNKWVEPYYCPILLPRERLQCVGRTQTEAGGLPKSKRESWESREAKQIECAGQGTGRAAQKMNSRDLQRCLPSLSWVHIIICMWENYLEQWKKLPKRIWETKFWGTHRVRNHPSSLPRMENFLIHRVSGATVRNVLPQREWITPRLNTTLV